MGNFAPIGPINCHKSVAALITSFCVSFDIIDWAIACIIYALLILPLKLIPSINSIRQSCMSPIGPAGFGRCILPRPDKGPFYLGFFSSFPP